MFVRILGCETGAPLLLLHGQFMGASLFDPFVERLARTHRLVVPDLPGYGRSPLPPAFALDAVRRALEAELGRLGIASVAAVGFSLGAYHAIALALAGRVRVTHLALLGPLAGGDPEALAPFAGFARMARAGEPLDELFASVSIPPARAAADPGYVGAIRAAVAAAPAATLAAEFDAIAALPDLRPRLGEIRAPTLVRVGAEDRNTPPAGAREIAAAIPGARLEVVPGVGHLLFHEDGPGTLASVERFLGARR